MIKTTHAKANEYPVSWDAVKCVFDRTDQVGHPELREVLGQEHYTFELDLLLPRQLYEWTTHRLY